MDVTDPNYTPFLNPSWFEDGEDWREAEASVAEYVARERLRCVLILEKRVPSCPTTTAKYHTAEAEAAVRSVLREVIEEMKSLPT